MSRLKDLIKNAPVHEREISVRTYPIDDERLVIDGRLKDERFVRGYKWNGAPASPGVVHWISVRFLMGGWPLSILDAEAEMPSGPHDMCPSTMTSVKKLIGLTISSGFSDQVRNLLGGVSGCAHLTHLVLSMGTAALHGYWSQRSREPLPLPRSLDEFPGLSLLMNSCRLWRKDGPIIREIRDILDNEKARMEGRNKEGYPE